MARRRSDMDSDRHWTLDKKIPLALILMLCIQSGTAIWWAAKTDTRITALEASKIEAAPQADRLTRVEEKIGFITEGVAEIKRLIQQRPSTR